MLRAFIKQLTVASFILSVGCYVHASEERKEKYEQHYGPFEKYVLALQSSLWWGRKTGTVAMGAKVQGYDEFVIQTCIPASYPLFDRPKDDLKKILKKVVSRDNIIHIDALLKKCSKNPDDINFVAHTTYQHGKAIEQAKKDKGDEVSEEDKDTFVAGGLFVRYWIEKKLPLS